MTQLRFTWLDYGLFIGMVSLSGFVGIFFGCFGTKQNSSTEYLLGGKSMQVFPVAMSIVASYISGLTVLAVPADIYRYGASYIWTLIPIIISSLASALVYMPVFLKLEIISTYQYLHIRFDKSIKMLASFLYVLHITIYNPIVIFLPCVALSQATGYNVNVLAPIITAFCVFYTAIGGLKAVVWTDTIQTVSVVVGSLVVLAMGIYQSSGLSNVFRVAREGGRLDIFNFTLDPTVRDNFWAYALGATSLWLVDVGVGQGTLQRLSAVPTVKQTKRVMLIFCAVSILITTFAVLTGIAMYAKYAHCDPMESERIAHMDELLPMYVMDVGGFILGLPGLFIAGVLAAALSTLSTNLLNLATIVYVDFFPVFVKESFSEEKKSCVLKLIVIVIGGVDCGLVFLVGKFGGLLQFGATVFGMTYGTLLGLFTLGTIFPVANKQGALCGVISGIIFSICMVCGNLWYKYQGLLPDYPKPTSIDGCNGTVSISSKAGNASMGEIPPGFFRISFWYYPFYGCIVVIIMGLLVSWITPKNGTRIRPELISPMFQFLLSGNEVSNDTHYKRIGDSIELTVSQKAPEFSS